MKVYIYRERERERERFTSGFVRKNVRILETIWVGKHPHPNIFQFFAKAGAVS